MSQNGFLWTSITSKPVQHPWYTVAKRILLDNGETTENERLKKTLFGFYLTIILLTIFRRLLQRTSKDGVWDLLKQDFLQARCTEGWNWKEEQEEAKNREVEKAGVPAYHTQSV